MKCSFYPPVSRQLHIRRMQAPMRDPLAAFARCAAGVTKRARDNPQSIEKVRQLESHFTESALRFVSSRHKRLRAAAETC